MEIRRFARGLAWGCAGLVALLVLAGAALLLVNRRDQPPSAAASQLHALIDARIAVADADNAYVDALGIAAPREQDPLAFGRLRKQVVDAKATQGSGIEGFALPGRDVDYRAARAPRVTRLATACERPEPDCLVLLAQDPGTLDAWLASEAWLLARYRAMLLRPQWQETPPADARAPIPAYAPLLDGQRLSLLAMLRQAQAGDAVGVRARLQDDLRYWRMVLASSDMLITKIIAAAAIERHFVFGNQILRALPAAQAQAAIPDAWRVPLSAAERSLLRPLAGEWRMLSGELALAEASAAADSPGWRGLPVRLEARLMQRQATLNLVAERSVALAARAAVPYAELPQVMAAMGEPRALPAVLHPYNPIGRMLDGAIVDGSYLRYAPRLADLEGVRRVSLLAAQLRAGDPARLGEQVQASPLRDPYTGAAFGWDGSARTLHYDGLGEQPTVHLRVPL